MSKSVVILGAGRTGRGLLAVIAARAGWGVTLVDRDPVLVARLTAAGTFPVTALRTVSVETEYITPELIADVASNDWHHAAAQARVIFCAVIGTNLPAAGVSLAAALIARHAAGVVAPLDVVVAENRAHSARVLRDAVAGALSAEKSPAVRDAILSHVGFVEAMVLTTSLAPEAGHDPLLVRTQDFFRLPCDADAFIAGDPGLPGLQLMPYFGHQLVRKLSTYNGINAVISYLGAERGHVYLADATRDAAIAPLARHAGDEASAALIAEFGFDVAEQQRWCSDALAKFADIAIPDPIERNAADPARKLAIDDRLLCPALLALRHGIQPVALACGIAAALRYREAGATLLERYGTVAAALAATAGLAPDHPLIPLVERAMKNARPAPNRSKEAFAALDLGTSRLRVGALVPGDRQLTVVASVTNVVVFGADGSARCSFAAQWRAVEGLLGALATWCRKRGVTRLHLGMCGQVSSLLRWRGDAPVDDSYPIWQDSTCRTALPELTALLADGRDVDLLGTRLPPATNWLATKILAHIRNHGETASQFLQIHDAIFVRLTGACLTHPGSQVSLVDQRTGTYCTQLLLDLGCDPARLPTIDAHGAAELHDRWDLPPTTVYAGLQDTHAAVLGLFPEPGDGVLLAGTSEVIGVLLRNPPRQPPQKAMCTCLGDGWFVYGSSASGGATVSWLVERVLRRKGPAALAALMRSAAAAGPGADGVLCLPYPGGERAPIWDSEATGSFSGLRSHHSDGHLVRAVLDGVALARRQVAEALEQPLPERLLVAGGSASNPLWNRIRAAVFGKPLLVQTDSEPALIGAIRHAMIEAGADCTILRSLARTTTVVPDAAWCASYADVYVRFRAAHGVLHA